MASRSSGVSPPSARHHLMACSGSSHVENGTGRLPCLRRLKRSSSAAATIWPSTTIAAAGSWNTALTPSTVATRTAFPRLGRSLLTARSLPERSASQTAQRSTSQIGCALRSRRPTRRTPARHTRLHIMSASGTTARLGGDEMTTTMTTMTTMVTTTMTEQQLDHALTECRARVEAAALAAVPPRPQVWRRSPPTRSPVSSTRPPGRVVPIVRRAG
jgi:hypothetical protein